MSDANERVSVDTLTHIVERGRDLPQEPAYTGGSDDQLAIIMYTSGSTGAPKGAMITERTLARLWTANFAPSTGGAVLNVNFMPLNHVGGRLPITSAFLAGGTSYFVPEPDLSTLFEDWSLVRPTDLPLVPRVVDMLFQRYRSAADRLIAGGSSRAEAEAAAAAELRDDVLGGRVIGGFVGTAPLAAEMKTFIDTVLGEVGGPTRDGVVMRPPVIEYKLVDVPELGYFLTDKPRKDIAPQPQRALRRAAGADVRRAGRRSRRRIAGTARGRGRPAGARQRPEGRAVCSGIDRCRRRPGIPLHRPRRRLAVGADLRDLLRGHRGPRRRPTLDKFIDARTLVAAPATAYVSGQPKTVLLTGANGWLGRFLTLELLERAARDGGTVITVVRGRDEAAARARLEAAFDSGDPGLLERFRRLAEDHLEVVAGDIGEPDLGVDKVTWDRLAHNVDQIIHPAALVNHVLPYSEEFGPNVVGTAEVIRLAITAQIKPVTHLSTVAVALSVAADDFVEDGDIREVSPERPVDSSYANGYADSKWAGEVLLREAHDLCGLPVAVFRSDMILAHTRYAGQRNVPDAFTRLVQSILITGSRRARSTRGTPTAGPSGHITTGCRWISSPRRSSPSRRRRQTVTALMT